MSERFEHQKAARGEREDGHDECGVVLLQHLELTGILGLERFEHTADAHTVVVRTLGVLPGDEQQHDFVTAHVDADSAATIGQVVERLARTRTVIAVTHQSDLVARADEHLALRQPEVAR